MDIFRPWIHYNERVIDEFELNGDNEGEFKRFVETAIIWTESYIDCMKKQQWSGFGPHIDFEGYLEKAKRSIARFKALLDSNEDDRRSIVNAIKRDLR